jgi:hypothetical protein
MGGGPIGTAALWEPISLPWFAYAMPTAKPGVAETVALLAFYRQQLAIAEREGHSDLDAIATLVASLVIHLLQLLSGPEPDNEASPELALKPDHERAPRLPGGTRQPVGARAP